MTALDTNVLVRLIVEDDEAQTAAATSSIERLLERDGGAFVPDVVLVELARVLRRSYRCTREEVADALVGLIESREVRLQDPTRAHRALIAYHHGRGDFADYFIRTVAEDAGCEAVLTFDEALLSERGFTRPVA